MFREAYSRRNEPKAKSTVLPVSPECHDSRVTLKTTRWLRIKSRMVCTVGSTCKIIPLQSSLIWARSCSALRRGIVIFFHLLASPPSGSSSGCRDSPVRSLIFKLISFLMIHQFYCRPSYVTVCSGKTLRKQTQQTLQKWKGTELRALAARQICHCVFTHRIYVQRS